MARGAGGKKGAAAAGRQQQPQEVEEDPAVARVREFEAGVGHVLGRKPTAAQQNRAVPSSLRPRGAWVYCWGAWVWFMLGPLN